MRKRFLPSFVGLSMACFLSTNSMAADIQADRLILCPYDESVTGFSAKKKATIFWEPCSYHSNPIPYVLKDLNQNISGILEAESTYPSDELQIRIQKELLKQRDWMYRALDHEFNKRWAKEHAAYYRKEGIDLLLDKAAISQRIRDNLGLNKAFRLRHNKFTEENNLKSLFQPTPSSLQVTSSLLRTHLDFLFKLVTILKTSLDTGEFDPPPAIQQQAAEE